MLFSRIASYLVGFASIGILATASALPAVESEEKKRQVDSVTDVLTTLETTVNSILPQISKFPSNIREEQAAELIIGALDPGSLTSASAVSPLISELTGAITTATASLSGGGLFGKRADNAQEVATQLSGITTVRRVLCTTLEDTD